MNLHFTLILLHTDYLNISINLKWIYISLWFYYILDSQKNLANSDEFTFHFDSITLYKVSNLNKYCWKFTFHFDSITLVTLIDMCQGLANLHFTLILLHLALCYIFDLFSRIYISLWFYYILNRPRKLSVGVEFTFHFDSITFF